MKENQPQTSPVYPVQYISSAENEISLVDIWLTFRKHRKLFLVTAIGVTLLGLILALLTPKSYNLRTSLEIGAVISGKSTKSIESPQTVKAKLENSLIPMVKNELNSDKGKIKGYAVSVSIPKKSSLIVLTSKISKENEATYKEFHNKIVEAVSQDHSKVIKVLKKSLQTELALANISLDEIQDPVTLDALTKAQIKILEDVKSDLGALSNSEIFDAKLKAEESKLQEQKGRLASLEGLPVLLYRQLKQIDAYQELIKNQIKELEAEIYDSTILKKQSAQGVKSGTQAMAQLTIDSDVQQSRKLLAELREQLFITLENEKIAIHMSLEDNKRSQGLQMDKIAEEEASLKAFIGNNLLEQNKLKASVEEIEANIAQLINAQKRRAATQQQKVGEIQTRLDSLMETRAVAEPMLSSKPTSTPKRVIFLIAIFLGGLLGIAAVFFAELRENVAQKVAEQ